MGSDNPGSVGAPAPNARPQSATCTGLLAQPLDAQWTLESGGLTRTFYVHVPASYDRTHRVPLVLDFHGYTSDAAEEMALTGMPGKADAEGFIAVHPEGVGASWNAGDCCGQAAAQNLDDVGFVRAMLDQLESALCIDAHRIYSTGMSNGGFFSHRLACELSDRIAAIAPVAGVIGVKDCSPSRAVPVYEFHGTADTLVPYGGDPVLGTPSVMDTFTGWSRRDLCAGAPVAVFSSSDAHCSAYEECAQQSEVVLCTIDNGGHTWPGGLPVPALGYTALDLSATDQMWQFFARHALP